MAEVKENLVDDGRKLKDKSTSKSIDEMLEIVGGYGRFQKTINIMFGIMTLPPGYAILISYFTFNAPSWKCRANSTTCNLNGTYLTSDKRYCHYERSDWEYVEPRGYNIVTQFDLQCEKEWLVELTTSTLFVGWFFGSIFLGWWSDNYGRRKPIFISTAAIILFGFISAFMPNIYAFISCRFIIGFFLPGTFQQVMFLYISEIVGGEHRAFAGLSLFLFVNIALIILALKAYFIHQWKLLYIVCTAPYAFILFFYSYVPESMRYLRVKGKVDEVMNVFKSVAERNGTEIPYGVYIEPHPILVKNRTVSSLDLFRTPKIFLISLIQGITYFVGAMSFYCLYLGAANISGHMYRDYVIITLAELPVSMMIMDFTERFGRKRTVMISMLIGSLMCIPMGFIPKRGSMKIARIIFGMIGKVSISAHCNSIQSWSVELYPTNIRGVGMGFLLLMARLGSASAAFVNKEFAKFHEGASYVFIGVCLFIVLFMLFFLPEMKGNSISDGEDTEKIIKEDC